MAKNEDQHKYLVYTLSIYCNMLVGRLSSNWNKFVYLQLSLYPFNVNCKPAPQTYTVLFSASSQPLSSLPLVLILNVPNVKIGNDNSASVAQLSYSRSKQESTSVDWKFSAAYLIPVIP